MVNSPYYKAMIDMIAEVGPGVKPPTPYEISSKFLDMEHEECKPNNISESGMNMVVR